MRETRINGRWSLTLPEHRAARPEWKTGWEAERLDALHQAIEVGSVVIDVGAEMGDMSALFATWDAALALFEPNPKVWPSARAIFESNGLSQPVCFAGFASSTTDQASAPPTASWPPAAYGEVVANYEFKSLKHDLAPQIRLDDCDLTPDVISIDVEGSEWEVLKGAERTLRERSPILFLSIHPELMLRDYGHYERDMHDWLRGLGYTGEHLAFQHEHHWVFRA